MKKIYSGLLGIFLTTFAQSQNFTHVNYSNLVIGSDGDCIFGDVDGDNDKDVLIVASNFPPIANLYINDGTGQFTEDTNAPFTGVEAGSAVFVDVDNDNDLDVLIAGGIAGSPSQTKLYLNDGNGNFTLVLGTPFISVYNCAIDFADIDGDNDMDILIAGEGISGGSYSYLSKLYTNDGAGNFTEVVGTTFIGASYGTINFADIDGDNDKDVVITGHNGAQFQTNVYQNDGNGVFTSIAHPFPNVAVSSVALADVDGDSDLDILLTGDSNYSNPTPTAQMFLNDGNGNFTLKTGTPFLPVVWSSVEFSDIDNDNDLDVLITGNSSTDFNNPNFQTKLFLNDGLGNFTLDNTNNFPGYDLSDVSFADVDNNGFSDIFIMGDANMFMNNLCQLNTNITITNEIVLTADQTGATYQWLDCNNGNAPITGETNQSFTATANGSYAVEITDEVCTDTSNCITVSTIGLTENENILKIFPNPASTNLVIVLLNSTKNNTVSFYNNLGQKISDVNINSTKTNIDISDFEEGIYFIKTTTNSGQIITKKFTVIK